MRIVTAMIMSAALCASSGSFAQTYNTNLLDQTLLTQHFSSLDACEDALAHARRAIAEQNHYTGRDLGQSNRAFNQRYHCVHHEHAFTIVDRHAH